MELWTSVYVWYMYDCTVKIFVLVCITWLAIKMEVEFTVQVYISTWEVSFCKIDSRQTPAQFMGGGLGLGG